jgi:hypothetical protein
MCFDPHRSAQAEPVDVDAQGLARCSPGGIAPRKVSPFCPARGPEAKR